MTDRVRLGTSVLDALFHAPVVLAKRYATLDQLSRGRAPAGIQRAAGVIGSPTVTAARS
jgi:alkanesulfonate monooxygenase SsuD/methylene tetrahydromethanopterin reductase-like flavin-dependent oxidoreductase (luciferase family)